jgi:hypothetical protein
MADLPNRSLPESSARKDAAAKLQDLTSRFEMLLQQAEGFTRGGDYLGAQARARYANDELANIAASGRVADVDIDDLRRHLDLRLRHYDLLARDWQQENVARQDAFLARERQAIGAQVADASKPRQRKLATVFRRLLTAAFGCWTAGAMRMGCAS